MKYQDIKFDIGTNEVKQDNQKMRIILCL